MRMNEVEKMERQEVSYNILLSKITLYRQRLEKVTLFRRKNGKGRLVSQFICYLVDEHDNVHTERYRLYDDEYVWFSCALQQDFPELDFVDLSADEYKVGENAI